MSGTFKMEIDRADLDNVKRMLADIKGAGARVTARALNKTLTGVKTDSSAAIRDVVTAKKAAVDETLKISKATTVNPSAYITSTGRPLALIDYSARQTNKGVSVQVRKDRARKIVPRTFISAMKSGHKGVFWRRWHQGVASKMNKTESAINRSGYVWSAKLNRWISIAWLPKAFRLPIEERFGPRVPDIMSNDPVMKGILAKADDRLHKNITHELEYELSKHK
jgi:hypothetical protein